MHCYIKKSPQFTPLFYISATSKKFFIVNTKKLHIQLQQKTIYITTMLWVVGAQFYEGDELLSMEEVVPYSIKDALSQYLGEGAVHFKDKYGTQYYFNKTVQQNLSKSCPQRKHQGTTYLRKTLELITWQI
eukprot:TRINITY_DN12631_c0_g1_i3.p5 TRINITY_DN12631_c0_g1~~TRINITY_DN12631_c0_g1_i3.p5  ORF type:complete len:131 (-),score=6.10 TRINITY_DN12631_c0_g1_i3:482-874(-)